MRAYVCVRQPSEVWRNSSTLKCPQKMTAGKVKRAHVVLLSTWTIPELKSPIRLVARVLPETAHAFHPTNAVQLESHC